MTSAFSLGRVAQLRRYGPAEARLDGTSLTRGIRAPLTSTGTIRSFLCGLAPVPRLPFGANRDERDLTAREDTQCVNRVEQAKLRYRSKSKR